MYSILPETLKSFDYYLKKIPAYLRNDECFVEHFKIWYEILMNVGPTNDTILNLLDVFSDTYLDDIAKLLDYEDKCDLLDKIASIYGLKRELSVTYKPDPTSSPVTETIYLNDAELLVLLKAKIIRNNYDGTYELAKAYYEYAKLEIVVVRTSGLQATVDAYLNKTEQVSPNIEKMFKASMLTIESVGIDYNHYFVMDIVSFLIWANKDGQEGSKTWADKNGENGGLFSA